MSEIIIRGGTILTVDEQSRVMIGDIACADGRIVQVGGTYTPEGRDYEILEAEDCVVMPGLVQAHVHMCQTLARGWADELSLLDWLQQVVWPYEAAMDEQAVDASARLACLELITGGTTSILDMGTVHHTDALFAAARDAGLRATIGKAMMDVDDPVIPVRLRETTQESLDESERLCREWHGRVGGRLRYAFAPRFALSCTEELLRGVAERARAVGTRIHTHSSENVDELAEVRSRTGLSNVRYLDKVGLTGPDVCLAHCVWVGQDERRILRTSGTHVVHCPSSNLKLGSGVAEIPELIDSGISVSLGADGAPCNNNLDGFMEMRLASLIHKPRCGPRSMPASQVVRLATVGGARALGIDADVGSLEVGKRADIIVVSLAGAHVAPCTRPYSAIVHACRATDVRHVLIDGKVIMRQREVLTLDQDRVLAVAREQAERLRRQLRA